MLHAEDRYAGGEQERSTQAQRGLQHGEQEDPDEGAELAARSPQGPGAVPHCWARSLRACVGQATFQLRSPSRATTSMAGPSRKLAGGKV